MVNFKSKVLAAFAWFFGIVFIIGGLSIGVAEGGIITALLMLVGGCLLLPPVKRLILDRKPNLSIGKITTVGTILIVIAYAFLFSSEEFQQASVVDDQALSDITDSSSVETAPELEEEVVEEVVEEEIVSIDAGFINPEEEDGYYEDGYNTQAYEDTTVTTELVESKRSKLPNPFIDFNVSIKTVDNTPLLAFVSRNKEPLQIYDIIINDGISCDIYGDKNSRTGLVNFGEKFDFFVIDCSQDQIVEVKVITEKGYNIFTF